VERLAAEPRLSQLLGMDHGPRRELLGEVPDVHRHELLVKGVLEPDLGESALERHLAALEAVHGLAAGAADLALVPAAGHLALAAAAAADALAISVGARRRLEVAEHRSVLLCGVLRPLARALALSARHALHRDEVGHLVDH